MAYPRWLAHINKRVFNPRELRKAKRPIVMHVGRTSGRIYQTPMDAHPTRDGYVMVVRYGPHSDWVRNITVSGSATLRIEGDQHELEAPRLVPQDVAARELVTEMDPRSDFFKAEHYLLMNRAG